MRGGWCARLSAPPRPRLALFAPAALRVALALAPARKGIHWAQSAARKGAEALEEALFGEGEQVEALRVLDGDGGSAARRVHLLDRERRALRDERLEGRPLLRRQRGRAEGQHRLDASRGARGVHLRTSGGGTSPPQVLVRSRAHPSRRGEAARRRRPVCGAAVPGRECGLSRLGSVGGLRLEGEVGQRRAISGNLGQSWEISGDCALEARSGSGSRAADEERARLSPGAPLSRSASCTCGASLGHVQDVSRTRRSQRLARLPRARQVRSGLASERGEGAVCGGSEERADAADPAGARGVVQGGEAVGVGRVDAHSVGREEGGEALLLS